MKSFRFPFLIWIAVLGVYVAFILFSQSRPERIATHFDLAGHANGWMSRSSYIAFMLTMGVGTSLFTIGLFYALRYFPSEMLNAPNKNYWITKENYSAACDFLLRQGFGLATLLLLFLGMLDYSTIEANKLSPPVLAIPNFTGITVLFITAIGIWCLRLVLFFRKTPPMSPCDKAIPE